MGDFFDTKVNFCLFLELSLNIRKQDDFHFEYFNASLDKQLAVVLCFYEKLVDFLLWRYQHVIRNSFANACYCLLGCVRVRNIWNGLVKVSRVELEHSRRPRLLLQDSIQSASLNRVFQGVLENGERKELLDSSVFLDV